MGALADRIYAQAALASRPGQFLALSALAVEVAALERRVPAHAALTDAAVALRTIPRLDPPVYLDAIAARLKETDA